MILGLAYDLKSDIFPSASGPDDTLEEYDSVETIDCLAEALASFGHTVVHLGGGKTFLTAVLSHTVDMVFTVAEGRGTYRSREVQVPAVLEMLDIPYTGSDPACLAVCLDKPLAKHLAASAGINTPRWRLIADRHALCDGSPSGFSFPVFVKPAWEGSSKGIGRTSRVNGIPEMEREVIRLHDLYRQPVLVEEFIRGRELTVGIVGTPPRVMGIMEVIPRRGKDPDFFYSIDIKRDWQRQVRYECPADLPGKLEDRIIADSLMLFKTLGCRDMARIDFRLDVQGQPYFIEANPLPGLNPGHSDYPMLARYRGIDYRTLIGSILESALSRQEICARMSV